MVIGLILWKHYQIESFISDDGDWILIMLSDHNCDELVITDDDADVENELEALFPLIEKQLFSWKEF